MPDGHIQELFSSSVKGIQRSKSPESPCITKMHNPECSRGPSRILIPLHVTFKSGMAVLYLAWKCETNKREKRGSLCVRERELVIDVVYCLHADWLKCVNFPHLAAP